MKIELSPTSDDYRVIHFPGGETDVRLMSDTIDRLHQLHKGRNELDLVARIRSNADLIEMLHLTSAIRGVTPNLHIHCWLPYLPYSRADRRFLPGDCFGLETFAAIINAQDYASVITYDVHSGAAAKLVKRLVNVEVDGFGGQIAKAIVDFAGRYASAPGMVDVLFPDAGAAQRYKLPVQLGCNTRNVECRFVYATKKRDAATGKLSGFEVPMLNSPTIIVDDLCDGGGTFLGIADVARGDAEYCPPMGLYVTHGIFSKGIPVLQYRFLHIYCMDTYQQYPETPGLTVYPVVVRS